MLATRQTSEHRLQLLLERVDYEEIDGGRDGHAHSGPGEQAERSYTTEHFRIVVRLAPVNHRRSAKLPAWEHPGNLLELLFLRLERLPLEGPDAQPEHSRFAVLRIDFRGAPRRWRRSFQTKVCTERSDTTSGRDRARAGAPLGPELDHLPAIKVVGLLTMRLVEPDVAAGVDLAGAD